MQRPRSTQLVIGGPEIDALIAGATPYDPRRMPAHNFAPAQRHVAALGHLIRRYHDPSAWIREASFAFNWTQLRVNGPADELDALVSLIELHRSAAAEVPTPIVFAYFELDAGNIPAYDSEKLRFLSGADLAVLAEADLTGDAIIAEHRELIRAGLPLFFGEHLSAHFFLDPVWSIETYGVRFDTEPYRVGVPSPLERPTPNESSLPVLGRLFSAVRGTPSRDPEAALDDEGLREWLTAQIRSGALALRDFGADGLIWPALVLSEDRTRATGVRRDEHGRWRLVGGIRVTPASRRFAERSPERALTEGELP